MNTLKKFSAIGYMLAFFSGVFIALFAKLTFGNLILGISSDAYIIFDHKTDSIMSLLSLGTWILGWIIVYKEKLSRSSPSTDKTSDKSIQKDGDLGLIVLTITISSFLFLIICYRLIFNSYS